MLRSGRFACVAVVLFVLVGLLCGTAHGGTIIKLSLASDPDPDVEYDGTTLSTADDLDVGTTGEQNTAVEFQDFLSGIADILTPTASFTLGGLAPDGSATVIGGFLVIQNFTGGTLNLYDPANGLLLSGTLDSSTMTGPLGPPATGALFTTSFALVTGGLLAPLIDEDTLTLSMSLTDIDGGAGFSVSPGPPDVVPPIDILDPFKADVTLNIAAEPIPEPVTVLLLVLGATLVGFSVSRRRR